MYIFISFYSFICLISFDIKEKNIKWGSAPTFLHVGFCSPNVPRKDPGASQRPRAGSVASRPVTTDRRSSLPVHLAEFLGDQWASDIYPLVNSQFAVENGPFIVDLP